MAGIRTFLGGEVRKKAEQTAQLLFMTCVDLSPVYTGNFRASWNVSEKIPIYKDIYGGSPESPLAPPSVKVKATSDFPKFYITNGKPYAVKIEEGWSRTQAPAGVMREAVKRVRGN
jgi:hypothetical protein